MSAAKRTTTTENRTMTARLQCGNRKTYCFVMRQSCKFSMTVLRQPCTWREIIVRTSYGCLTSCDSVKNRLRSDSRSLRSVSRGKNARVLRLSYVAQKTHTNRKENEHVENLVFDVAAALRPCLSKGSLAV